MDDDTSTGPVWADGGPVAMSTVRHSWGSITGRRWPLWTRVPVSWWVLVTIWTVWELQ
jgi:hypothetical protein